jgi:hypothetical protein
MELSTSGVLPERPMRPVAAGPPIAVAREPKGEGRAIASLILTIVGVLSGPFTFGVIALLGLMLAADAWEDIERDPMQRGRGLAMATFWIIGASFALLLVGGAIALIVG